MKIINWILKIYYSIIAWFILRDGHTINHFVASDKNIITDAKGNVIVWKDSSGQGNDAKVYPDDNIEVVELIIRDIADPKWKSKSIYARLKYKNHIKENFNEDKDN